MRKINHLKKSRVFPARYGCQLMSFWFAAHSMPRVSQGIARTAPASIGFMQNAPRHKICDITQRGVRALG